MKATKPIHSLTIVLEACLLGAMTTILIHGTCCDVWAGKPNLFAVIVGISEYDDPRIHTVKHAASDARDVQSFIEDQQRQRRLFARAYVKPLFDKRATKSNILAALKQHLAEAHRDDIVIVYLAGHGEWSSNDHHYFLPYDVGEDLARTGIAMGDPALLEHVQSERVLVAADTCSSGGYEPMLRKEAARKSSRLFDGWTKSRGRFGMWAAAPGEDAFSSPDFRKGLFTHYFLKGLRGEAASSRNGRVITVKALFDYVQAHVQAEAEKLGVRQMPQLSDPSDQAATTPVYLTEQFETDLNIRVKVFYEDNEHQLQEITNQSKLKSGQHFGIAFRPDADCYVHIFCWDTFGQVRRLFPNPALTEGSGYAKAGETVWLPYKGSKHWYVLDTNPGKETIYFVASRRRSLRLEELYRALEALSPQERLGEEGRKLAEQIEREVNLIRSGELQDNADVLTQTDMKHGLFAAFERRLRVEGAEAVCTWELQHVAP